MRLAARALVGLALVQSLRQPVRMAAAPKPPSTSRRRLLGGAAAACALGAFSRPAAATYGSSSAAVTSPAPTKRLTVEQFEKLGAKKLKQREGALGPRVVDEILEELEASVADLARAAAARRTTRRRVVRVCDDGGTSFVRVTTAPRPAVVRVGGAIA